MNKCSVAKSSRMETNAKENSESSPALADAVVEQNHDNLVSDLSNHGDMESKHDFAEEEIRGTLEISASTGKFWQDWEKLRSMLSFYLKQVLSEYPESKMTTEQQISLLGETFSELVKRLDDAVHSFDEGPPFTLQRICEILLSARNIYPKLSKLALALEKNLLVTSTLTISSDSYPPATIQKSNGAYEKPENPQHQVNSVENGVEPAVGDGDEIMAEAEETEVDEGMTIDMETIEEIARSSEANSTPTVES
ncbi:serine threonine- phosphatase 4 regulatory subunit 2 isoform X1 [Olea europaea subsp. europaea]|uniref:Serine threonine- phosphatase 4 regulatory subunit 2 isoform X1 n=2 Tax=Olea europaea subsp. europaea TaxID=158383 RepID=A0A8S0TEA6_OLEEU|nr:serine threonine- phosphatase 4 regulatory subunit 2 isoform X1 [Olea europaea subsp. europaea]